MDTLTFLDPEEQDLLGADTQGDEYKFNFTVNSQSQQHQFGGGGGDPQSVGTGVSRVRHRDRVVSVFSLNM